MRRLAVLVSSLVIAVTGLGFALVRATSAGAAGATVTISSSGCAGGALFCFSPSSVTVADGSTVTWKNTTGVEHTVTRCSVSACGVGPGTGTDTSFSSMDVAPASGSTVMHTFHGSGTYVYYCLIHGYAAMHGTIQVTGVPSAPTMVKATPGNTTATVSWTAPAANNAGGLTGYVVTPYVGATAQKSQSFTSTATHETITGLTNGVAYTFKVAAKNAIGTGPSSAASAPVIVGAPAPPTGVRAVPRAATTTGPLLVSFTPGANNGATITSFTATCRSSNSGVTGTTTGTASPLTVSSLTTAKTYTCAVKATNSRGTGPSSSASAPVIVGAPTAPTGVSVTKVASGQLKATFTPGANNGATITSFTATCTSSNGGVSGSKTGTASPLTVASLTPTKTYTCTVKATNSRGTGPPSVPSAAITA